MVVQREDLTRRVVEAHTKFVHVMQVWASSSPAWADLDLTMSQMKALVFLAPGKPLTVGELATALGVGRPASSILVDRLVELGLADRSEDQEDRRRTLVRLTAKADDIIMQLRQGKRERLAEALDRLRENDLADLARGLSALAEAVSASPTAAMAEESIVGGRD